MATRTQVAVTRTRGSNLMLQLMEPLSRETTGCRTVSIISSEYYHKGLLPACLSIGIVDNKCFGNTLDIILSCTAILIWYKLYFVLSTGKLDTVKNVKAYGGKEVQLLRSLTMALYGLKQFPTSSGFTAGIGATDARWIGCNLRGGG